MDESSILIIGSTGQLGSALSKKYPSALAVNSDELDIVNTEAVQNFDWSGIKIVLNAAAYTDVDSAETNQGRVSSWEVNAVGPYNLVKAALANNHLLIHISTDYVFDGTNENHTESEPFSPLSVYGASKAAGDLLVSLLPAYYILRSSWVIGEGKNFVRTMIGVGEKGISPSVVADQIGRLTFTSELVKIIDHILTNKPPYGIYNATNGGTPASWADITRQIFKLKGFDLSVKDTTAKEYFAGKPASAKRPPNSVMDLSKLESIGFRSSDWSQGLEEYVKKEVTA